MSDMAITQEIGRRIEQMRLEKTSLNNRCQMS